jgi:YD repeat-containing protein
VAATSFEYFDAAGNVTGVKRALGRLTTYAYDTLNRATVTFGKTKKSKKRTLLFSSYSGLMRWRQRSFGRSSARLHGKHNRHYCYLHCRSDCYRLERPLADCVLHPLKIDAFSLWGANLVLS